ncbi:hypothetical protein [Sphingomonas sp. 8AM]|uniref:hypothetical protein n=1 Tax=Sphingomonas sp. 8AM TaxID=2653170 RepID=UPI0012EF1E67|nr:hypothetical protein [Sphingomonas sp. 8AM]VXC73451.1 conserved hypothetical protein [Sphingomonas sp. 8AM]
MGYRISQLAAKADKAAVLSHLGLTDTGEIDEANEAPLSAAELPGGWTIVWANDCDWADASRLTGMTPRPAVATLMVHEGVMAADLHVDDGAARWSLSYRGDEEGELAGDWPASFAPIVAEAQARERDDEGGEVDHLFDIPVAIMEAITGHRYDAVSGATFTIVENATPVTKRPWWNIF